MNGLQLVVAHNNRNFIFESVKASAMFCSLLSSFLQLTEKFLPNLQDASMRTIICIYFQLSSGLPLTTEASCHTTTTSRCWPDKNADIWRLLSHDRKVFLPLSFIFVSFEEPKLSSFISKMYNDDDEHFEYSYDCAKHLYQSPTLPQKLEKNKRMKWGRMYKRRIIKSKNYFVLRLGFYKCILFRHILSYCYNFCVFGSDCCWICQTKRRLAVRMRLSSGTVHNARLPRRVGGQASLLPSVSSSHKVSTASAS